MSWSGLEVRSVVWKPFFPFMWIYIHTNGQIFMKSAYMISLETLQCFVFVFGKHIRWVKSIAKLQLVKCANELQLILSRSAQCWKPSDIAVVTLWRCCCWVPTKHIFVFNDLRGNKLKLNKPHQFQKEMQLENAVSGLMISGYSTRCEQGFRWTHREGWAIVVSIHCQLSVNWLCAWQLTSVTSACAPLAFLPHPQMPSKYPN